jgi:hypothetical protein
MIHIITVNWTTDKWVDIQLDSFKKWINTPFKVYTRFGNMNEKIYNEHKDKYFCCLQGKVGEKSHATDGRREILSVVRGNLSEEDIIMVIDSDAFLINDISKLINKLESHPFIAAEEPNHEVDITFRTPHPMFYLFPAEYLLKGSLDWNMSHSISNAKSRGNWWGGILNWMDENNIEYYPIRRTNVVNLHPLYFAIYEDVIYHHWAGSRRMITAPDRRRHEQTKEPLDAIAEENHNLSEQVFEQIVQQKEDFMNYLLGKYKGEVE